MGMRRGVGWLILVGLLVGCAQSTSAPRAQTAGSDGPAHSAGPKRITIAITAEPPALYYALIPSPIRAAPGSIQEVVHLGLTEFDNVGVLRPVMAEAVPTAENGLWTVFPDGRMETTWRLRPEARWHDGTPLTADDLLFTAMVIQDRELAVFRDKLYDAIEAVEAPDARTVVVRWKTTVIDADTMFSYARGLAMPKHLLERPYVENKAAFTDLPYWSQDFVGAGPFRLKEWARGSHLVFSAFDQYLLGRPKLDEIEVRFIGDGNTLISNILAGSIDLTLRQALSVDQALQVRDQWTHGKVYIAPDGWAVVYAQSLNPTPAIVGNPQFRQALLHAIDRQQLADELMGGLVPVADVMFTPDTPEYRELESALVRHPYDVQRAAQLIEGLDYTRGPDGGFRDPSGQRLAFETRAAAQRDIHVKTLFPVVDYWQRLGLQVESQVLTAQRATDREEQSTFPAFQVLRQPSGTDRLVAFHSSEARLPERNFIGSNNGRYMNPELDALIDRFRITIPRTERMQVARQIVAHLSDQLPVLPLFYDATPSLIATRLKGVTTLTGSEDGRQTWNVHEWDVTN
jgi:peptide/nickel transport system substrate-binding protein